MAPEKITCPAKVVASCPGKVLIAGGYTILVRPNHGLVLSTSARFETRASLTENPDDASSLKVLIKSPQYQQVINAKFTQELVLERVSGDKNPYVEQTVALGLAAAVHIETRLRVADDLAALFRNKDSCLETISFSKVMSTLNFHFQFKKMAFAVGDVSNDATSNQNSLKMLSVAKLFELKDDITKKLWGEHYRKVIADPNGSSHANLRAFIAGGISSVKFENTTGPINVMSHGASQILGGVDTSSFGNYFNSDLAGKTLEIELCADNDFYSQQSHLKSRNLPYTTESLKSLPSFLPCCNENGEVAKTGLGSSAAMVTSVIGALIMALVPSANSMSDTTKLDILHTYAQYIHAVIQGKIGSGFDVCSAVYGSCNFVRYDKECLAAAMSATDREGNAAGAKVALESMSELNHVVTPFQLPPRLELVCGDVSGGSDTPSMSRKILAWTKAAPEGEKQLWYDLVSANSNVAEHFKTLTSLAESDEAAYNKSIDKCCSIASDDDWAQVESDDPVLAELAGIRTAFYKVRSFLKKIGDLADVPVEPDVQTHVCNKAMREVPGVVVCGVPGAGGYDAVFAVVVDKNRKKLEDFWANDEKSSLCALTLHESKAHPGITFSNC